MIASYWILHQALQTRHLAHQQLSPRKLTDGKGLLFDPYCSSLSVITYDKQERIIVSEFKPRKDTRYSTSYEYSQHTHGEHCLLKEESLAELEHLICDGLSDRKSGLRFSCKDGLNPSPSKPTHQQTSLIPFSPYPE